MAVRFAADARWSAGRKQTDDHLGELPRAADRHRVKYIDVTSQITTGCNCSKIENLVTTLPISWPLADPQDAHVCLSKAVIITELSMRVIPCSPQPQSPQ